MFLESFEHTLSNEEKAKFSIFETHIEGKKYFHAMVVGTEIKPYENLSDEQKKVYYGIDMRQGGKKIIYKTDKNILIKEIKEKYGTDNEISSDL
jgi:hypothetical protein